MESRFVNCIVIDHTYSGNFQVYDFWTPPPPINLDMIDHVAAAPGTLACPSRGALPPRLS